MPARDTLAMNALSTCAVRLHVAAAVSYAGTLPEDGGSIMQLTFDIGSRGAMVHWLSQFPAEEELLECTQDSKLCLSQRLRVQVTSSKVSLTRVVRSDL